MKKTNDSNLPEIQKISKTSEILNSSKITNGYEIMLMIDNEIANKKNELDELNMKINFSLNQSNVLSSFKKIVESIICNKNVISEKSFIKTNHFLEGIDKKFFTKKESKNFVIFRYIEVEGNSTKELPKEFTNLMKTLISKEDDMVENIMNFDMNSSESIKNFLEKTITIKILGIRYDISKQKFSLAFEENKIHPLEKFPQEIKKNIFRNDDKSLKKTSWKSMHLSNQSKLDVKYLMKLSKTIILNENYHNFKKSESLLKEIIDMIIKNSPLMDYCYTISNSENYGL